jgi:DmsE family decaheme c-type cytochrome
MVKVAWLAVVACCGAIVAVAGPGLAAEKPGETTICLDCHDDQAANLARSPHPVLEGDALTRIACTDCHAGSSAHWEDDPEEYPMANPATLDVAGTAAVCAGCHINPHQENQAGLSPHARADVTCTDCHQVHGARLGAGLKTDQLSLCYSCHGAQRGEFARPYSHPVREYGFMECTACHLAGDDGLAPLSRLRANESCLECHREFQGPFPHDHLAAVDYATEEGACIACHEPHGSFVPRLLKQPYEAPHYQLCSQCHVVPRHQYNSFHGSDWAGVACNECHVDIHGSYDNRFFLSRTLEAQGCFAAGCHSR